MGGQRYWKDGRDVYDFIMGLLDYPETEKHPAFTLALQCNFEDGGGGDTMFRFVGSDGVINVSFTQLTLNRAGIVQPSRNEVLKGYNSVVTFSKAMQKELAEKLHDRAAAEILVEEPRAGPRSTRFRAGYDERLRPLRQLLHLGPREEARLRERDVRLPRRGPCPALQRRA